MMRDLRVLLPASLASPGRVSLCERNATLSLRRLEVFSMISQKAAGGGSGSQAQASRATIRHERE
jgi:hypothetical protein